MAGAVQATSHYLNQWWLAYWHICASLSPNELSSDIIFQDNTLDYIVPDVTTILDQEEMKCTWLVGMAATFPGNYIISAIVTWHNILN